MKRANERYRKVYRWVLAQQTVTGIIIGLALSLLCAHFWIRQQARTAVLEPEFIGRLAKLTRPYMIVDSAGSINADYGATEYIANIKYEYSSNYLEMKMTVELKTHQANAPLVRAIDPGLYADRSERGNKHDWIIWMRCGVKTFINVPYAPSDIGVPGIDAFDTNRHYRLFIEILH